MHKRTYLVYIHTQKMFFSVFCTFEHFGASATYFPPSQTLANWREKVGESRNRACAVATWLQTYFKYNTLTLIQFIRRISIDFLSRYICTYWALMGWTASNFAQGEVIGQNNIDETYLSWWYQMSWGNQITYFTKFWNYVPFNHVLSVSYIIANLYCTCLSACFKFA